jgi:diguanylate cyclase (GGDEF)-like protein/PAS domain S-box-containing protein
MAELLRVLMVVDPPEQALQIKKLADEAGHAGQLPDLRVQFELASRLDDCQESMAAGACDALLLDFSGSADLQRLAELRHNFPTLPVIIIVSPANESLALLALAQGASDYLFPASVDVCSLAEVLRHTATQVRAMASQRRLAWLEENIGEAVWRAQPDLSLVEVSSSISRLAGFTVDEALKSRLFDWIVPDFRSALKDALESLYSCEGSAASAWNACLELEHLHKDAAPFWAEIRMHAVLNAQGQTAGIVGVTRDISARHAVQEKLDYLSMHDPLTGLFNRAYFVEELKRLEFSRMYPITVLLADLEGLKAINFQYGLAAGDEMIKQTAALLHKAFRSEDLVARIGGDEFIAIMPRCNTRVAGRALQRVVNLVEAFNEEQASPSLRLSLGIATAEQGQSLMDTIKAAGTQKFNRQIPV